MSEEFADAVENPLRDRGLSPLLVGALLISGIVVMIDQSATVVALPAIRDEFDVGAGALVWVQIASAVAGVAVAIPTGAIGDRYGRGRVVVTGMALFAAGALISSFASGPTDAAPTWLIVGRFLSGAGGTMVTVLALALLTSSVPRARIPWVVGMWTALTSGAAALAPLLSGLIVDSLGWRWVFALPLIPLALAALTMAVFRPDFAPRSTNKVSWIAAPALAAGLLLLTAAFTALENGTSDLAKASIMFVSGLALLGWFAVAQSRSANPLVTWSELHAPGVLRALTGRAIVALTFGASMFQVSLLLLNALDYTPSQVGALSIPPTLASITMSMLSGRISPRIGVPLTAAGGCAALAIGVGWLSTLNPDTPTWAIGAALAIVGSGNGLLTATLSAAVLGALPKRSQGQGSGVFLFATLVPGVVGLSLIGIVTATRIRSLWSAQTAGPCATDGEVLSDIGSGAIGDVADSCGAALGESARAIYIDGVTSVLQAIAVILAMAALGALWGLQRLAHPLTDGQPAPSGPAAG